jgi:hypothetical protein
MTHKLTPSAAIPETFACAEASADVENAEDMTNALSPAYNPDTPADYDPADYRWVPVRRRPRYDGWTEEKQRRFIEVLADTGIVTAAARAVGMSRESAGRLRRSPHGAAFARAWDAARHHAGSVLEDIAFERAIEGIEQNIYDDTGEVVCTKRVYNDRLLTFLLGALKPERYGRFSQQLSAPEAPLLPEVALDTSLRAMEPQLPAPIEQLLDTETLANELQIAEIIDGTLPQYLSEQRPLKSAAQQRDEKIAAQQERGRAAFEKQERGDGRLSNGEFKDMCAYIDPTRQNEPGKKRFR